MSQQLNLRAITACSSASFAVFGICLTLPGALLPLLVDQFGISLVEAGSMLAFQPGAYLVAVLLAGWLLERVSTRLILSVSVLVMALGLVAFGLVASWIAASLTLFVSGMGLGVLEVATNTLLIRAGGERRSNLLNFSHLFFGVGSFLAPVLSTHAVSAGWSWRVPFFVSGVLTTVVAAAWYAVPGIDQREGAHAHEDSGLRRVGRGPVIVLASLLGVYVGVETGVGSWLTKYLVNVRALTLDQAGNVLSLYWLALAAGRLVLSVFAHRAPEETLIATLALGTCVTLAAALAAGASQSAALGFTATGAMLSGIFPTVVALAGRRYPQHTARVTSILIAGAGVGGIVIPWIMSAIANAAGLVAGMRFYIAMSVLMLTLALLVRRVPR